MHVGDVMLCVHALQRGSLPLAPPGAVEAPCSSTSSLHGGVGVVAWCGVHVHVHVHVHVGDVMFLMECC